MKPVTAAAMRVIGMIASASFLSLFTGMLLAGWLDRASIAMRVDIQKEIRADNQKFMDGSKVRMDRLEVLTTALELRSKELLDSAKDMARSIERSDVIHIEIHKEVLDFQNQTLMGVVGETRQLVWDLATPETEARLDLLYRVRALERSQSNHDAGDSVNGSNRKIDSPETSRTN